MKYGEKFVTHEDQCALLCLSFQDCHFKVLGFTNGQGKPVGCIIILASMEETEEYIMGLQPWTSEVLGDPSINIVENSHGPLWTQNVETYVTCNEKGSIIGKNLTDVLKHVDTHINMTTKKQHHSYYMMAIEADLSSISQGV
jgi:hypothetical protein